MANFEVWIEAEEWEAGQWVPTDSVTDVVVTLADGTRWVAGFCTYEHVNTLRRSCAESGECMSGKYLWASDLILIDDTSRPSIEAVVGDLIAKDELTSAFSEILEEEGEDGDGGHEGHTH
jgi:hypothetical protein